MYAAESSLEFSSVYTLPLACWAQWLSKALVRWRAATRWRSQISFVDAPSQRRRRRSKAWVLLTCLVACLARLDVHRRQVLAFFRCSVGGNAPSVAVDCTASRTNASAARTTTTCRACRCARRCIGVGSACRDGFAWKVGSSGGGGGGGATSTISTTITSRCLVDQAAYGRSNIGIELASIGHAHNRCASRAVVLRWQIRELQPSDGSPAHIKVAAESRIIPQAAPGTNVRLHHRVALEALAGNRAKDQYHLDTRPIDTAKRFGDCWCRSPFGHFDRHINTRFHRTSHQKVACRTVAVATTATATAAAARTWLSAFGRISGTTGRSTLSCASVSFATCSASSSTTVAAVAGINR
jgi:hypothetical protein